MDKKIDNKKYILIADDEKEIRDVLQILLTSEGYEVISVDDGQKVVENASDEIDLYILDVNMPNLSGFLAASKIREKYDTPIIFLTAYSSESDKVMGFSIGADDYIVKPFDSMELLARIEAVLRRRGKSDDSFKYKNVKVDFSQRTVAIDGEFIELTSQEFNLLEVLIKNKNLALSRDFLVEKAWGYDYFGDTRTVDIHVQRLRKKLNWDNVIVTVFKYGYRLEIDK